MSLVLGVYAGNVHADARAQDWWVYVHNDQAANVRELLAAGADPNVRYRNGQPALMRAVVEGAWNVFDLLAGARGIDLEAQNPAGETPLMYLAVIGQTDRARTLIARGAKVNRLGWTPLHYAASKGHLDMARLLLQHEAMPNAPAPDGTTPLMMAAFSGSRPMVDLLLGAGANPATQNTEGRDAADWAAAAGYAGLAESLRERVAQARTGREPRRAGASGPKAGKPAAPKTAPPAAAGATPKAAPDDQGGSTLKGVSGVGLQRYD